MIKIFVHEIHFHEYTVMFASIGKTLSLVIICKNNSLDIHDIIEFLQEVRVQVIVFACECVKIHQHVFLHSDVVHDMDKV